MKGGRGAARRSALAQPFSGHGLSSTSNRDPGVISDYCRDKCGVVLGRGIGDLQGRAFRIAHMGHVNAPMVFGVLGAIEMALAALDIPHGRGGLQAAVEYLGREVRP